MRRDLPSLSCSGEILAGEARCSVLSILTNILPALSEDLCSQTRKVLGHLGLRVGKEVLTEVLVSTSRRHGIW